MPVARSSARSVVTSPSAGAPTLLGATLIGQKEGEGSSPVVAALSVSTAGVTLVTLNAIYTANRAGLTLNNGNTIGAASGADGFSYAYTPDFPLHGIEGRSLVNAAGGSNHSLTLTKSGLATQEATVFIAAVSGGSVTATSVIRNNSTADATLTSSDFVVASGSNALCIAVWAGSGWSQGSVVQDFTMDSAGWSIMTGNLNGSPGDMSFVHSGVTAPNGHIQLKVWVGTFTPGTRTWQGRPQYGEGGVMATFVVQ